LLSHCIPSMDISGLMNDESDSCILDKTDFFNDIKMIANEDEIIRLKTVINESENTIHELSQKLKSKEEQNKQLEQDLIETISKMHKSEEKSSEYDELSQQLDLLKNEHQNVCNKNEKIFCQLTNANDVISELKINLDHIEESKSDESEIMSDKLEQMKGVHGAMEREIGRLSKELNEKTNENEILSSNIKQLQLMMEMNHDSTNEKVQSLTMQISQIQKERNEQLRRYEVEMKDKMNEIEELNNEVIHLQNALTTQNNEFRRFKMSKKSENDKCKQLSIKLQAQIEQNNALNAELCATKAKLDKFRKDTSQSFVDLSFVQSEQVNMQQSHCFDDDLSESKKENKLLQKTISILTEKINEVTFQMNKIVMESQMKDDEIARLNQLLCVKDDEIKKLKASSKGFNHNAKNRFLGVCMLASMILITVRKTYTPQTKNR